MSATFGNPREWAKKVGLENYEIISIKSDWDYSKSPIYVNEGLKMNYHNIQNNLPMMIQKVDYLLDNNINSKGIIHTGNFRITKEFLATSRHSNRILSYNNAQEKHIAIRELKDSSNKILVGPSLHEGLDLIGDLARFSIFMKVPYPPIVDNFIKAKMSIDSQFYSWSTMMTFIQALGRTHRSSNDYCDTYLVDGCY